MGATCGSCGAEIAWATTENGRSMPLNAIPDDTGNIAVHRENGELYARVLKPGQDAAPWEKRGTSHHSTCPNADAHRKPRAKKREPVTCRTVEVDGQAVLVRGQGEPTDQDRDALAEVIGAAKRKYEGETT